MVEAAGARFLDAQRKRGAPEPEISDDEAEIETAIEADERDYVTVTPQFDLAGSPPHSKLLIPLERRDVRVVEGARLEIALAVCDGVLQISITVAKATA
jgi:hypothetical protein